MSLVSMVVDGVLVKTRDLNFLEMYGMIFPLCMIRLTSPWLLHYLSSFSNFLCVCCSEGVMSGWI